jgi:DUF4097 and DUF4098 domain-containing protein YvlB
MMERTFATPGHVRVIVGNDIGHVVVSARTGATTDVTLEPDSSGAQELVDRATVECRPSGQDHVIRVKVPHTQGMKFMRRNGITVRIDMPTGGDVEIATASADVELNGTVGEATIKTASGDITADDAAGSFQAKSASGDITVGSVAGHLRLHSTSGDVRADRVGGSAAVATTSGDLEIGAVADKVDVRSTSGDVRLGDVAGDSSIVGISGNVRVLSFASGRMQVRAVSGDIGVGIALGVNLSVDAQTMSGTVHSDIPLHDEKGSHDGGSEVSLSIRNVSGDVLIERAVEAYAR